MLISDILAPESQKGLKVETKGLLKSLEEKVAKNGKPFIRGVIADKELSIPFQSWGYTKKTFLKGIDEPIGKVIELQGTLDVYNEEKNIIITVEKGFPKFSVVEDANTEEFLNVSSLEIQKAFNTLYSCVKKFENEEIKDICLAILTKYSKELLFFPYGKTHHTEKGGAMAHMWQVVCRIKKRVKPISEDAEINEELLIAGAICSRLSIFSKYTVDETTGEILAIDEAGYSLFSGASDAFALASFLDSKDKGEETEVSKALKHMCLCLGKVNGEYIVKPAFLEANMLFRFTLEELETNAFIESGKQIEAGSSQRIPCLGRKITRLSI